MPAQSYPWVECRSLFLGHFNYLPIEPPWVLHEWGVTVVWIFSRVSLCDMVGRGWQDNLISLALYDQNGHSILPQRVVA